MNNMNQFEEEGNKFESQEGKTLEFNKLNLVDRQKVRNAFLSKNPEAKLQVCNANDINEVAQMFKYTGLTQSDYFKNKYGDLDFEFSNRFKCVKQLIDVGLVQQVMDAKNKLRGYKITEDMSKEIIQCARMEYRENQESFNDTMKGEGNYYSEKIIEINETNKNREALERKFKMGDNGLN